jgi:hypothetical protein
MPKYVKKILKFLWIAIIYFFILIWLVDNINDGPTFFWVLLFIIIVHILITHPSRLQGYKEEYREKLANRRERFNKEIEVIFNKKKGFNHGQKLYSFDCKNAIALNEKENEICLIYKSKIDDFESVTFFDCEDLISTEIVVDGKTITKTNKDGAVMSAIAGGLLFGGAGAIVGAIAADETSETEKDSERIDLVLNVNDTKNPVISLNFFYVEEYKGSWSSWMNPKERSLKDPKLISEKLEEISYWNGIFKALISRKSDGFVKGPRVEKNKEDDKSNVSFADEIIKLSKLKEFKVISLTEFNILKEKVIDQSANEDESKASEILKLSSLLKNKEITQKEFVKLKNKIIEN